MVLPDEHPTLLIAEVPQTKDLLIIGYCAPAARIGAEEGLGHRDGAKRRAALQEDGVEHG